MDHEKTGDYGRSFSDYGAESSDYQTTMTENPSGTIDYGICKLEMDAVIDGTANPFWSAVRGVHCIGAICPAWDARTGRCRAKAQK